MPRLGWRREGIEGKERNWKAATEIQQKPYLGLTQAIAVERKCLEGEINEILRMSRDGF